MDKQILKLNKNIEEFGEYVSFLTYMPPSGENAKYYAIQEFKNCTANLINKIKSIRNEVIKKVEKE